MKTFLLSFIFTASAALTVVILWVLLVLFFSL